MPDDHALPEPFIRVIRGTPTPEELAALVGVVIARSRPALAGPPQPTASAWTLSARPGGGRSSWRASGLPR
jgi:hypothetical protein